MRTVLGRVMSQKKSEAVRTTMAPKTTISCAEFERLAGTLGPAELVDGEIVGMSPGGFTHSKITSRFHYLIYDFVASNRLGHVLTNEVGIHVQETPPRSRGADIAYISYQTLAPDAAPTGFLTFPPDLIVEVLGDDDTVEKLRDKIDDYHRFGVRMVWIADPRARSVTRFPLGEPETTLGPDATLDGGSILPGFSLRVGHLFEPN